MLSVLVAEAGAHDASAVGVAVVEGTSEIEGVGDGESLNCATSDAVMVKTRDCCAVATGELESAQGSKYRLQSEEYRPVTVHVFVVVVSVGDGHGAAVHVREQKYEGGV